MYNVTITKPNGTTDFYEFVSMVNQNHGGVVLLYGNTVISYPWYLVTSYTVERSL